MFTLAADISLRILAAAAAVGLVLVVLRVRSGAARHAAWSAVLLAMLTMPVLTVIVPRVEVPVPSTLALDFESIASGRGPYEGFATPPVNLDSSEPQPIPAVSAVQGQHGPAGLPFDWRTAAIAVYAAGVLFFLVRIAGGWILARRLVVGATRVTHDNRAPVFESAAVVTPMTTGVVSPCVLLPMTWREWPEDKLNAVLAHENAHIARRDSLVALLAHANRAIFWFHPLAWWLERILAVTAEHACDETAAREVGQPRRYAEVLLDMAEAVRLRGHRVSWQAMGVDGSGLLGARIDRLLRGDAMPRMSGVQRVAVSVGCAAVLVLAIACRQQIAAEPLRPDPEVQKQIDDTKARGERHRAAVAMTAAEAAALEKTLEANPDNLEARETLIIFYDQAGKVTWEEKLAGIRKHALWRLAHLPETDLWIPNISKRYDPEGYAQAKQLWLEQTSRPEATPKTLGRAAAFLSAYDKPAAEELLLRAQRLEPGGPWSDRLADLYARAIVGSVDPRYGTTDAAEAQSAFAAEVRRKLEATSDPKLLAAAGSVLMRYSRPAPAGSANALGRRLLERAATLDPQNARARSAQADLAYYDRRRAIEGRLRAAGARGASEEFSDTMYAAISALPAEDRLFYLPGAAEGAYMGAEYIDYTAREKPEAEQAQARKRAAQGFARARQYANDALDLARNQQQAARDNDVIYRAETVLGVLALKDGDREGAVEHMRTAGAAPMSDAGPYRPHFGLRGRLVEYLLRAGERASVAEYLEKSADRYLPERDRLLKDAAQIRAGVMPLSFQYAESRR
ncbi:MAG TPA: M56 family metallopeptidase [Vicinamibacterales bacterium]|nr:M56 family metallopeptidase [Vicinamibacterales bacterium]